MTTPPIILSDKAIPFDYRMYEDDWEKTWDSKDKVLLPRVDVFKYVFWEKEYVCKWFVSNNKKELPDSIRIARYRAYPVGPGRAKAGKEESLKWVKNNLPYICLLHCYTDYRVAARVYLKFEDEFMEGEDLMSKRHEIKLVHHINTVGGRDKPIETKLVDDEDDNDAYSYYGGGHGHFPGYF